MNSSLCQCHKDDIRSRATAAGAFRTGFARAGALPESELRRYDAWIADDFCGEMDYLRRHATLRAHTDNVLPGAKTVIAMAFPYAPDVHHPHIADYALGADYHSVLRLRLDDVVRFLADNFGAESRICTDSAPIAERFWAVRSGIGFIGDNHQLFIPGYGCGFFLAEILTTLEIEPDEPCREECLKCGRCRTACPGGALLPDGRFDARRCQSYLTIEHKGEIPAGQDFGPRIYGCDVCRRVCPLSADALVEPLPEFTPRQELMQLDREAILNLNGSQYKRLVRDSAMRRVPLARLKRNASGGHQ